MDIQRVNCMIMVRANESDQHPSLGVYRCGNNPLPVTEVRLMQAQHGMDAVSMVSVTDEYETTAKAERERLATIYRAELLNLVYPIAATMFPRTIEDLDLEPEHFDRVDAA